MSFSLFDPVLFDDLVFGPVGHAKHAHTSSNTSPLRVDLKEESDRFLIIADLPGCSKEDVHVDVLEHVVTLAAERKREELKDTVKLHRMERHFGRVSRSFKLPETANTQAISANYTNGVLTVTIDKFTPEQLPPKTRSVIIE